MKLRYLLILLALSSCAEIQHNPWSQKQKNIYTLSCIQAVEEAPELKELDSEHFCECTTDVLMSKYNFKDILEKEAIESSMRFCAKQSKRKPVEQVVY